MLSYFFIFLHISSYFFIFLHIRKYDFIFIDIYSCSTWALLFFLFFGAHCRFRRGGRAFLPFFFIPAAAPTANAAAPAHSAVSLQPPPIRKPPPTPSTWHWHQEKWSFIGKVRFKNWESPKTRNNLTLGSLRKIGTVRTTRNNLILVSLRICRFFPFFKQGLRHATKEEEDTSE